jgi:ribose 5-phosphate isomerase A
MDSKQAAVGAAFSLIKNNSSVGLGDGSTMIRLAGQLVEGIRNGLLVNIYTSSYSTGDFLKEAGITVLDNSLTDQLDQYFDGCDQIDADLNVFKSGSGIHTSEKLLASMAKQFIILADDSKFVSMLTNKFPLVLEVLPQSTRFVITKMKQLFRNASFLLRTVDQYEKPVVTRNGNYLIDCRFSELPELQSLQRECKNIPGVVEISLFYKMVTMAIIADNQGIRTYERNDEVVSLKLM